jgi:hypothetical protein
MTEKKGILFDVAVVVPGETFEESWKNFKKNPAKYIPEKPSDKIKVITSESNYIAVKTFAEPPERLDKHQLRYAEHFGWIQNGKGWWVKAAKEEDISEPKVAVMPWRRGWAPWHRATGVCDNAAWGDLRAAIRVTDEMFFDIKHFDPHDVALCGYCFKKINHEDYFFFEGSTYCDTACAINAF